MSFIIIIVIVGLVYYFGFYKPKKTNHGGSEAHVAPLQDDTAVDQLVEEALVVVNDFLTIGSDASILTDSSTYFRGHIIFVPDARPPFSGKTVNYGFFIKLCDLSDLTVGARKYPKLLANNPNLASNYNSFIAKYRNCYDASEVGYVYRTRRTVPLLKGQEHLLHAKLGAQIAQHCSLADFSGGFLYTKNVWREE